MTIEAIQDEYISVPEIATLSGLTLTQAHNLTRRHGFPAASIVWGRPVFPRQAVVTFLSNERVSKRSTANRRKRAA